MLKLALGLEKINFMTYDAKDARPLVSIIIRTLNEEKWISACLKSVFTQSYTNFEVIIVDNRSKDKTVEKASNFLIKLISIDSFTPGRAINLGIKSSLGDYIVCLSGHCIPTNEFWLENLVADLDDETIGGIYGRQQPLAFSSAIDKRDLLLVFGQDRKIQIKDPFFHNANSAFRRKLWEKFPFDENVSNIEDRVWGKKLIDSGYKIIYEPDASVFHWHGIHHNLDPIRAQKIVQIIENIDASVESEIDTDLHNLDIVCIIPIKGIPISVGNIKLVSYTINSALKSKYINRIIISTDNEEAAQLAIDYDLDEAFMRPSNLSEDYIDNSEVLSYTLAHIEAKYGIPDIVVLMDETYPFRSENMIDNLIERLVEKGMDTIVSVKKESRGIWLSSQGSVNEIVHPLTPNTYQEDFGLIALIGLGLVTRPMPLRNRTLFNGDIGYYQIEDSMSTIQFTSKTMNKNLKFFFHMLNHQTIQKTNLVMDVGEFHENY